MIQIHPVVYLEKCAEILNDVYIYPIKLNEINIEYIRILKLMVNVTAIIQPNSDEAK